MDSLTQITLGAAVGELVLGKKVGNRAMLWGAIAGTIPDLDVLAGSVTDEISALAYHRAFTHSLAFACIAPLGLGALVHRLYGGKSGPLPLAFIPAWGTSALFFFTTIAIGSLLMPLQVNGSLSIAAVVTAAILFFPLILHLRERFRRQPSTNGNVHWLSWTHLFFWSIITHPLLDTCTTYGTQLWQPFASDRIALNNVAVADPLYTIPFLIFVIWASRISHHRRFRRWVNITGLIVSSAYLMFTFVNKWKVDKVMQDSITAEKIQASRYLTSPTILNNILWTGLAECDTSFFYGQYSLLDRQARFSLRQIPKSHHLLQAHWDDRDITILRWFSKGYFNVLPMPDGTLQFNDLRFGGLGNDLERPEDYIFRFILEEKEGKLIAKQDQRPPDISFRDAFTDLWRRIQGR
jgi:inner membrane protein